MFTLQLYNAPCTKIYHLENMEHCTLNQLDAVAAVLTQPLKNSAICKKPTFNRHNFLTNHDI